LLSARRCAGHRLLAEQGIGICQTYDFIVQERIVGGWLVELLPELAWRAPPFSLAYALH
jgi:hypothetical protein